MAEPTKRQAAVLDMLLAAEASHQPTPTYREIGDALGISSTNGVADHVRALQAKGFVQNERGKSRSLCLTPKARRRSRRQVVTVPVDDGSGLAIRWDGRLTNGRYPLLTHFIDDDGDEPTLYDVGIGSGHVCLVEQNRIPKPGDLVLLQLGNRRVVRPCLRIHTDDFGYVVEIRSHTPMPTHHDDDNVVGVVIANLCPRSGASLRRER